MSNDTLDQDRLWEEGLDLTLQLQNDPTNPAMHDRLREWRARSVLHEQAWSEIVEIHAMAGEVLRPRTKPRLSRRALLIGGGVGVGALATASIVGPRLWLESRADILTAKAEVSTVPLEDGTLATLGPDSALKLDFRPGRRAVELLAGMAYFEPGPGDVPFVARSGPVSASLHEGAFDIGTDASVTTVSSDRGVVEVGMADQVARLEAGQWLSLNTATRSLDRGMREAGQVAAWRDGMLFVEREPVAAVVARIARWQAGAVVIADFEFGDQPVSGVYNAREPLQALAAVVHPYGGKVHQLSPWLTVIAKI